MLHYCVCDLSNVLFWSFSIASACLFVKNIMFLSYDLFIFSAINLVSNVFGYLLLKSDTNSAKPGAVCTSFVQRGSDSMFLGQDSVLNLHTFWRYAQKFNEFFIKKWFVLTLIAFILRKSQNLRAQETLQRA